MSLELEKRSMILLQPRRVIRGVHTTQCLKIGTKYLKMKINASIAQTLLICLWLSALNIMSPIASTINLHATAPLIS
jgi:hypothetical protein